MKELAELEEIILKPKATNTQEQNYALAQAYALKGLRDYLENRIRHRAAYLVVISKDELEVNQGRLLELKEILGALKHSFNESEKIKVMEKVHKGRI